MCAHEPPMITHPTAPRERGSKSSWSELRCSVAVRQGSYQQTWNTNPLTQVFMSSWSCTVRRSPRGQTMDWN
jgi:hypothetical protein